MVTIHLGLVLPPASSDLPGSHISTETFCAETRRATSPPLFGLAPNGVYQAVLLPGRWCALTAPFHPYRSAEADSPCEQGLLYGGIFSVALSVGSPRPRVTGHPALWCSDFPPKFQEFERPPDPLQPLKNYVYVSQTASKIASSKTSPMIFNDVHIKL